ncbi:hypothetical protein GGR57DRAFT_417315 [Xylariaceae sp. FL1272]|nr:hypothetical protein GGR57DRAFT_417315 [Xylariaceae sp. FL1272]
MGLFKSASNAGRSRLDHPGSIRGKISGPIPIGDDDEFPMRHPGSVFAVEGEPRQPNYEDAIAERASVAMSSHTSAREPEADSAVESGPSQASTAATHQRRQTLRYSTASEITNLDLTARKKSTLRLTIAKIFGRKKKTSRSGSASEAQRRPLEDQRKSSPLTTARKHGTEGEPKRSASLPINEFNQALRSHSLGPDDLVAIRSSLQDPDFVFSRKRAVTSSDRYSNIRDGAMGITGLSPRPASAQARDAVDDVDPNTIGRAISGDLSSTRRRSRSLSQLPDVGEAQGIVRNRSAEIRYWRASHVPESLPSPVQDEAKPNDQSEDAEAQPDVPLQPFDFGPMRITKAASLEDRITALEAQNKQLETLVYKLLQVGASAKHPINSNSRTALHDDLNTALYSSHKSESNESFQDSNTFVGSTSVFPIAAQRPLSNSTIRGVASLPTLSGHLTPDHFATMKALLDAERVERQTLEIQVTKLTHKVDMLTTMKYQHGEDAAPVSRFDDDDDDEESLSPSVGDASDAFKTPREEYHGAFGEELREEQDDGSHKRARTLSLSQLTLGKSKRHEPTQGVDL